MALTRACRETVLARVEAVPKFRTNLLEEGIEPCSRSTWTAARLYARLIVAPVRNAMEEATATMRRTGEA